MKVKEVISRAAALAGVSGFEGNAIDQNVMSSCWKIFQQTMNKISNDPSIPLFEAVLSYQSANIDTSLFPEGTALPFPISNSYPLPINCQNVVQCTMLATEIRKATFAEVIRNRHVSQFNNLYALNANRIELIWPASITIVYNSKIPSWLPSDEMNIPGFAYDYIINQLARDIALSWNQESVQRCNILASESYAALCDTMRAQEGPIYINPYLMLNRLMGRWVSNTW